MSKKIIVTGAAGFIGSNLVKALNEKGLVNIVAVDNLAKSDKFKNLVDCEIDNYFDKYDFIRQLEAGRFDGAVQTIFHMGACSNTMESDGRYVMDNNFSYSYRLLDYCLNHEIQYIYASSASVYGGGRLFREERICESPLNIYAYSKFLFDQVVRNALHRGLRSQVVGLRYFNVYGPREAHKEHMASVVYHLYHQYKKDGKVRLFKGSHGYGDGEQLRDFIYVGDVVKVTLFFFEHPEKSGIYNVGTGHAHTFNDVAKAVVNSIRVLEGKSPLSLAEMKEKNIIEYIDFPEVLYSKYQSYTQADISLLRAAGYKNNFNDVETGVSLYIRFLHEGKF